MTPPFVIALIVVAVLVALVLILDWRRSSNLKKRLAAGGAMPRRSKFDGTPRPPMNEAGGAEARHIHNKDW